MSTAPVRGYPPAIYQAIKHAVPVTELIDSLAIKRRGQSFRCPNGSAHKHGDRHLSGWIASSGKTWTCMGCHIYGSVIDLVMFVHGLSSTEAIRVLAQYAGISLPDLLAGSPAPSLRPIPSPVPPPEVAPRPAKPDVHAFLAQAQAALPTSDQAQAYLLRRGIPLELARKTGLGFAARTTWPHTRGKGQPRLVAPLTTPEGMLLTLYGRSTVDCPKSLRHDFLPGDKGVFHAASLAEDGVILLEGVFDALACLAAGRPATAICGLSIRDTWWAAIRAPRVILAVDGDQAGQDRAIILAETGAQAGKIIHILRPEHLQTHKDLNEYWVAHHTLPAVLKRPLRAWRPPTAVDAPHTPVPA